MSVYKLIGYLNYDIRFVCHANQDQSRLDALDALHHIIARCIECKKLFTDDVDRDNFLNRLEKRIGVKAWIVNNDCLPNHLLP